MVAQKNLMKKAIHYTIIAIFNSILNPTFYNQGEKRGGGKVKFTVDINFMYTVQKTFLFQEIMEHKLKQQMV